MAHPAVRGCRRGDGVAVMHGNISPPFWSRVYFSGVPRPDMDTPCWEWIGTMFPDGYGSARHPLSGRRGARAHRVSWELERGPITHGLLVCHRCDNPPCVRPDHLFLGDHLANMDDSRKKGRFYANRLIRTAEACVRGHVRTPENVRTDPATGVDYCRVCNRAAQARRQMRLRSAGALGGLR